jgi:hypothetical protein
MTAVSFCISLEKRKKENFLSAEGNNPLKSAGKP